MQAWIKKFLGFTLPDCKLTQYSDSTPLDFVYEVYRAIMDGTSLSIMALAGRDASKTVSLSVIDLLAMLHDERSAVHIGMTGKQASRARSYLDNYIIKNKLISPSIIKENKSEIVLNVNGKDVGLELISCKPKQVQGAHASLLSYDELASSVEPDIVKGYRDSAGIPGSSDKGKPAVIIRITSRQAGYSLAEQELKKGKMKVVKWTTIDAMERCPDERSGVDFEPLYISILKGTKYTPDEFALLSPADQEDHELVATTRSKCKECPLAVYCQGRSKGQTSTSKLLRRVDDVIQKVHGGGTNEWAVSQIMSLQPSSEGLVYFEFKEQIHVPGWNRMWEILTGDTLPPTVKITRDMFVARLKKAGASFYAGIDWGWSHPSTCVVVAIDRRDNIFVMDSMGATMKHESEWVDIIKKAYHSKYDIQMYLPDTENPAGVDSFRRASLPVTEIDKGPGSVRRGISVLKSFLRLPGTNKDTKMWFAPDLYSKNPKDNGIMEELLLYHKEIDKEGDIVDDKNPAKEHDHYMDALRYCVDWVMSKAGKAKVLFPGSQDDGRPKSNVPDLTEIARMQGIVYTDNRDQFEHMGHQDDDPDDDPDNEGGGGASWAWT